METLSIVHMETCIIYLVFFSFTNEVEPRGKERELELIFNEGKDLISNIKRNYLHDFSIKRFFNMYKTD